MNKIIFNIKKLSDDIQLKTLLPVYLIIGNEPYLFQLVVEKIKDGIQKKTGLIPAIESFEENSRNTITLLQSLNSLSLFQSFRIIVIKNSRFLNDLDEKNTLLMKEWIQRASDETRRLSTVLVCHSETADLRKGVFKSIKKYGYVITFEKVKAYQKGFPEKDPFFYFAQNKLKNVKMDISKEAWLTLRQKVPNNMDAVMNAIDVLIAFKNGLGMISNKDVDSIIPFGDELPVFLITEALGEKSAPKILHYIQYILHSGVHPINLNHVLASRIRQLIIAGQLLKKISPSITMGKNLSYWDFLKITHPQLIQYLENNSFFAAFFKKTHPFALFSLLKQAQKLNVTDLEKCLVSLADIDFALKSSDKSPELMFELALLPLCH